MLAAEAFAQLWSRSSVRQLTLPPWLRTPGRQPVRDASGLRVRCWVAPTKCATLRSHSHTAPCTRPCTQFVGASVTRPRPGSVRLNIKGLVILPIRCETVFPTSSSSQLDSKADAVATRWSLYLCCVLSVYFTYLLLSALCSRSARRQANWAKQILSIECHHEKRNLANVGQINPSTLCVFLPTGVPVFVSPC